MKKGLTIVIASALITAAAIKAAPALAEAPAAEPAVSLVRTGDLDLHSAKGLRELDRRLARAAREVCGTASNADPKGGNLVRKCRDETLAAARSDRDQLLADARNGAVLAVSAAR